MSSTEITATDKVKTLDRVLIGGDLSTLSEEQRITYYMAVCDAVGLNHLTRPFEWLRLSGKLVLYARKDATDQLRKINGVSIEIVKTEIISGIYCVTAKAKDKFGREDSGIGAVPIEGLKGEAMANAIMKAETKAKRRVTLSICGLGMLDETEVDSIPKEQVQKVRPEMTANALTSKQVDAADLIANVFPDAEIVEEERLNESEWKVPATVKKFAGKRLRDCPMEALAKYVMWSRENIKFPNDDWKEFWSRSEEFLGG